MIGVHIDMSDLDRISAELGATPAEARLALRRAVSRGSSWLQTRMRRAIARGVKVPQRALRSRLVRGRVLERAGAVEIEIFVGLNPIDLALLSPRKTRAGVRTRASGNVRGAFLAKSRRGKTPVVFRRRGAARLPVERLAHPIREKGAAAARTRLASDEFAAYMLKTFRDDLLWRLTRRR